ncbi:hypothetical protein TGVAND_295662 [Toxoplasma gondii VAND]|uniref:Uncharacterized protein n=1 Tax=Toxoplasma gondii VAND TaxID=933077 RepID=A0A086PJ55_TOXGO|nr:hypothetical protein TGVAND_295662 [Toxoplasma gondii VAND]
MEPHTGWCVPSPANWNRLVSSLSSGPADPHCIETDRPTPPPSPRLCRRPIGKWILRVSDPLNRDWQFHSFSFFTSFHYLLSLNSFVSTMAPKIFSLVAVLGSLGTAAAVQPSVSNAGLALARETQVSMLQVQMQEKLSEMATAQLMEELGVDAAFSSALKETMSGFGKELLSSLKPTVTQICEDIVEQVAGYQQSVDEEALESDLGFAQISSSRVTDIAPHDVEKATALVDEQFWNKARNALKKVAAGVKKVASPIVSKVKDSLAAALKDLLSRIKPLLQTKLAEMISSVCDKAKDGLENATA